MGELEFIVALTEHRYMGLVFHPYLIRRRSRFYSVEKLVKPHDFEGGDYSFKTWEKELVQMMEKYSDERLMKRFSRNTGISNFFSKIDSGLFQRQMLPYIEHWMMEVARVLMLSPVRLFRKQAKYSNLYDEDVIEVSPVFATPHFHFQRSELQTRYRLTVKLLGKEMLLSSRTCTIVCNDPCLLLYRNQLVAFEILNAKRLLPFFEKDEVAAPNTIEDKYFSGFVLNTVRDFDVSAEGFDIEEGEVPHKAVLLLEQDLENRPALLLQFHYAQEIVKPSSKKKTVVSLRRTSDSWRFEKSDRDFEWERGVIGLLVKKGLSEANGHYRPTTLDLLPEKDALYHLLNWLSDNKNELADHNIVVVQNQVDKKYFTGERELEIIPHARDDWFDVYAVVRFGEFRIPFIRLKKYILNDIREFALPNGEIAILPEEWFERYRGLLPFGREKGESIRFHKHHFSMLQETLQGIDKDLKEKFLQLTGLEAEEVTVPSKLKASLRSYQQEGLNWMYGLYLNGLGACLADDMGLGKTLQTLTLLLKLKRSKTAIRVNVSKKNGQLDIFDNGDEVKESVQPASLIVLPTSLVHNWSNEIARFTPSLRVFHYVGTQRKKVENIGQIARYYDIILTTYGTVRNDIDQIASTEFFYLILDESQAIKNPGSLTYKSILKLKGRHKLVITGTPIENSLSDLWAQMNFLNPGLLGSLVFFRRNFITPIEKHGNEEQRDRLQMMIRPFVLRRKKSEVARDLPPLMEEVRICSMDSDQQKLYDREKSVIRNSILATIEKEGFKKSQLVVLQGLTRLRQLANYPSLMDEDAGESSGKFDEIFRMLHNVVAENHKVLVFSSFVTHLELLEERIRKQKWKYTKLTGKTIRREAVIKQFQEDPGNRIFLISLKAGGVGLNLTEADYVFITDPWWNPAAENQAVNRAHRIGQDKHVFVYRFITENSIEEKIQKLKERKRSLADAFINSNDPFKEISKEEIVDLFS